MKKNILYIIIIFISCILMNMGYAAISDEILDITGSAVANKMTGLFISEAHVVSGTGTVNAYEQTILNSSVTLDANSSSSTVTMSVTIVNNSGENLPFDKIVYDSSFYDNANIIVQTDSNLVHGQIVNDNSMVTFNITFKYDPTYIANNTAPYTNNLNSVINFKFGIDTPPVNSHIVTYNHITGANLPTYVEDGQDLVVIFDNPPPTSLYISGSTNYNYNAGTLIVYAVTNDLVISNVDNVQLPVSNDGSGVVVLNCPGFDTPVTLTNYLGMSFLGENLSSQTITRILVTINYSSSIGATRTANVNLLTDGNTYTQTATFNRGNNVNINLDYTNLDISLNEQFTLSVSGNNGHNNINVNSMSITAYYS